MERTQPFLEGLDVAALRPALPSLLVVHAVVAEAGAGAAARADAIAFEFSFPGQASAWWH